MWTDVTNLKITEFNSTKADIVIGFYPVVHGRSALDEPFIGNEIAHSFEPGSYFLYGDIHLKYDVPYSAFSFQGREFKIHGLLKVVCLSMCLCLLAYLTVCMSVCL